LHPRPVSIAARELGPKKALLIPAPHLIRFPYYSASNHHTPFSILLVAESCLVNPGTRRTKPRGDGVGNPTLRSTYEVVKNVLLAYSSTISPTANNVWLQPSSRTIHNVLPYPTLAYSADLGLPF
jgi:hypothetical protein